MSEFMEIEKQKVREEYYKKIRSFFECYEYFKILVKRAHNFNDIEFYKWFNEPCEQFIWVTPNQMIKKGFLTKMITQYEARF